MAAIPTGADPAPVTAELKKILNGYATNGVPAALVDASKKGEIASLEFEQNSISALAQSWSQALAGEGRNSPADIVDAIRKVTVEDVNRVARKYLVMEQAITGVLKPVPNGEATSAKGFGGAETTTVAPTKPVTLPDWAEVAVKSLKVPQAPPKPADMKLANGIRLIVLNVKASSTVTVIGSIKHEEDLQTPAGKDGADSVLSDLFNYGTKKRDRLNFQEDLDEIAASESGGTGFNLKVLKQYFDKGMELLADNELNPALPAEAFEVSKQQAARIPGRAIEEPRIQGAARLGNSAAAEGRSVAARSHAADSLQTDAG